jgi:hypothetical protein
MSPALKYSKTDYLSSGANNPKWNIYRRQFCHACLISGAVLSDNYSKKGYFDR